MIHEVPHVNALNLSSLKLHRAVLVEGAYSSEALCTEGSCWVDVRDLALAHVRTFTREKAGGERIIVSKGMSCSASWIPEFTLTSVFQGAFIWQDFGMCVHAKPGLILFAAEIVHCFKSTRLTHRTLRLYRGTGL